VEAARVEVLPHFSRRGRRPPRPHVRGAPVLSLYPRLLDGALSRCALVAVLLTLNLAVAMRFPYTAALSTATLYLAEAVLASPSSEPLCPPRATSAGHPARRGRVPPTRSSLRKGATRGLPRCRCGSRRRSTLPERCGPQVRRDGCRRPSGGGGGVDCLRYKIFPGLRMLWGSKICLSSLM